MATAWLDGVGDIFASSAEEEMSPVSSPARGTSFVGATWGTQPHSTSMDTNQCGEHTPHQAPSS